MPRANSVPKAKSTSPVAPPRGTPRGTPRGAPRAGPRYSVILPTYNEKDNLPLMMGLLDEAFSSQCVPPPVSGLPARPWTPRAEAASAPPHPCPLLTRARKC